MNGQEIQVFCDGESRRYTISEKISKTNRNYEYLYIFVEGGKVYQFKFEENKFLVGDVFHAEGEHLDSFACHVFGED